jgi:hypothetical protein
MKDAVATMGDVLPDDAGGRDAVHVAVFSAFSKVKLSPGQPIVIVEHTERDVEVADFKRSKDAVAIVDPFLGAPVLPGERFWAYLYPRTITALSHKWKHPAFEVADDTNYVSPSTKLKSEEWLKDFAQHNDCPRYDILVNTAILLSNTRGGYQPLNVSDDDNLSSNWDDEYWHFSGIDGHSSIPSEFWDHMENVTGLKFKHRPGYFSCSC